MNQQLIVLIALLAFLVLTFAVKLKITLACLVIPIILEVSGVLTFAETWSGLTNSSVIMMFAMLIVAEGFNKTGAVSKLSRKVIKPGASDRKILIGLAIPFFFLMQVCNGPTSVAIMYPVIVQVCAENKRPLSKFIYPLAAIIAACANLIPLGSNATAYIRNNTIINTLGGVGEYTYFTNTIVKLPFSILHVIIALTIGLALAPDLGNIPVIGESEEAARLAGRVPKKKLTETKSKMAVWIFVLVMVAVIVMAITKKGQTWWAPVIGAFLMVCLGIMNDKEAINAGASPMLFMFVAILPLATAITKTGADKTISDWFNNFTGNMSGFMIMMCMYLLCAVLTQFMSNSTVSQLFGMLAVIIAVGKGYRSMALYLAAYQGCANAYMLPTSNLNNNMLFEMGGYRMKDWMKQGLIYTVLDIVIFAVYIPLLYPLNA